MKKADTRKRILEAATHEFAEKGYKGATTNLIAARAGVNEITLFRHFKTKQELWDSILKQMTLTAAFSEELVAQMQQLPVREGMLKLASEYMAIWEQLAVMLRLQLIEAGNKYKEDDIPRGGLRKAFTKYLQDKQACGELRPDFDPKQAVDVFLAGIAGYVIAYHVLIPSEKPQSFEDFIQTHVDIFLKGVMSK